MQMMQTCIFLCLDNLMLTNIDKCSATLSVIFFTSLIYYIFISLMLLLYKTALGWPFSFKIKGRDIFKKT